MKTRVKQAVLARLPDWAAFCLSSAYSFTRQRLVSSADSDLPRVPEAERLAAAMAQDGLIVMPNFRSAEWCSEMRRELQRLAVAAFKP